MSGYWNLGKAAAKTKTGQKIIKKTFEYVKPKIAKNLKERRETIMGSIGRSIKRRQEKANLKAAKKEMNEKMGLFSLMTDECLVCEAPFDKTNKKMVDEWYMVVRQNPKPSMNLYCPTCWQSAADNIDK